jgi:2-keto-4-pentenoate hydratase/2-oxohepta-3-ene-1,7-dioic acid hydratase in catechol pathway
MVPVMTWFALGTFDGGQGPFPGLVLGDDAVHPLDAPVRALLDRWDDELPALQRRADALGGRPAPYRLDELRALPPVLPVGQVFQAGANYRTHVLELLAGAERRGDDSDGWGPQEREQARRALDERAAQGAPFVFTGCVHAMVGAGEDVVLPAGHAQPDWELELAAVIGRAGRRVPVERALEHVAGYTICNDVTLRDALRRPDVPGGFDWLAAKNSPTFLPTGPLLVPAVHAGDPMDLRIELSVNGRLMQDETTADMMFGVARLVAHVSAIAELRPGDLLLTGSPAGNGASHGVFLQPGDVMEGSITGLGTQRNRCVAERPAAVAV